jgi:hypothetical protein
MSTKYIICFLTVNPSITFINFINKLHSDKYSIYMCVDDNSYIIPDISNNNINIIKYDKKVCEIEGFKNTVLYFKNRACSRDKALYHFCRNEINFDYIWFIEEDVFIPSIDTIKNIDNLYNKGDLLCKSNDIVNEKLNSWHWNEVTPYIEPPYGRSMICAIRISKKLLYLIDEFAITNKTLFLDESLFNTLSIQNNLDIIKCKYLDYITYNNLFNKNQIKKTHLYHPVKDTELHQIYRKP